MSTPPAPVLPAGSFAPAPDAPHSFLVRPGSSSAASGPPPEPFLGRIVGRDYRSWVAARLQPSGTSVPAAPAVVPKAQPSTAQSETESDGTESVFDTPPSSPVAGGSAKRSSDGLGPGKAKKTRKTPTVPHRVPVLAHDDLPSSVVAAYEEVVAARPWERYFTQASFVPESLRGDPEWGTLHQALVDFW
ncbi:hypothetical protein DYB28_014690, partial [Aphanomyces astaci]